jgi:hypothetical protein
MSYQGLLTTSEGTPVQDGSYNLQFDIYNLPSGGTLRHTETHNGVAVNRGTFSIILGPLPAIFSESLYVEVRVLSGPGITSPITFSPRTELTSAPYALAPWSISGPNIYFYGGNVGIGTTSPTRRLEIVGGIEMSGQLLSTLAIGTPLVVTSTSTCPNLNADMVDGKHGSNIIDGSGAANYIPKFTGATTLGQSAIYQGGYYVGIGTAAPSADLHIAADDLIGKAVLRITNSASGGSSTDGIEIGHAGQNFVDANVWNREEGYLSLGTNNTDRLRITSDGRIGIGTINPTTALEVAGIVRSTLEGFKFPDGTVQGSAARGDGHSLDASDGDPTDAVYVDGNGNVGMGTTSPNMKLQLHASDVAGIRITNSITGVGGSDGIQISPPTGYSLDAIVWNRENGFLSLGTNNLHRMRITADGNVGIGTTTPSSMLEVAGTIHSSSGGFKFPDGTTQTSAGVWRGSGTASRIPKFESSDSLGNSVIFDVGGNIGIGTVSPNAALDVNGTARIRGFTFDVDGLLHNGGMTPGGGSNVVVDPAGKILMYFASSRRYKENISRLEIAPDDVFKLQPVRFTWKTTGQEDIGLIAEDVAEAVPDLVLYNSEGEPEAVKYDRIAVYLLEVVKQQQARISALEKQLARPEK